jgi:HEAT repeat protein
MKFLLLIFSIFLTFFTYGQSSKIDKTFIADFTKALDKKFSSESFYDIINSHYSLINAYSIDTSKSGNRYESSFSVYPLNEFKNDKLYKDNINSLLNSDNKNQRLLAYSVVGASNDLDKENTLLNALKSEKEKDNILRACISLIYLNCSKTTIIFESLLNNDDLGDSHIFPMFMTLNKDSLQKTAYEKILSHDNNTKIMAAQLLSVTKLNTKTEILLKQAIKNWDINIKGYAIFPLKELQVGNLLETFKPLLDSSQTRAIALQALANSPTKEDRNYILELTNQNDSISNELLECLYESKNIENIKIWLTLLQSKKVSKDYYFSVPNNKYIVSDELLTNLQTTLKTCKNEKVIQELSRGLEGRSDDESTSILLNFVQDKNPTIRYWSASALSGNTNLKVKTILPKLINDPVNRTTALVKLAIENKITNLHPTFEKIYKTSGGDLDWKRSSIEYLSNFPLAKNKDLFRQLLSNTKTNFSIRYDAALGLGRLKDKSSVDLLIKVCEETRKESDLNSRVYLEALSMIKGDKAKKEIQSYLKSKEKIVSEFVTELLGKWNDK